MEFNREAGLIAKSQRISRHQNQMNPRVLLAKLPRQLHAIRNRQAEVYQYQMGSVVPS